MKTNKLKDKISNFPIEIDEEFKDQTVQIKEEIEKDEEKTNQKFLNTLLAFYKEGLKAPKEKFKKKTELVLEAIADLRFKNLKIENEPDNEDMLIDDDNFFLEDDKKREYKSPANTQR